MNSRDVRQVLQALRMIFFTVLCYEFSKIVDTVQEKHQSMKKILYNKRTLRWNIWHNLNNFWPSILKG
jgi:hypothetical protein